MNGDQSMDHVSMMLVLSYLAEVDSAKSGEVAEHVNLTLPHVSLLLGRCWKRRLVDRTAYKRGRVRGFIYKLTERGADWLLYKASSKKEASSPAQPETETSRTNSETSKVKREIVIVKPVADNSSDTIMPWSLSYVFGQQAAQRATPFPVIIPSRLSEKEYYFLASKFEHKNEKEAKLFVDLLKEKDKTIRDLLRYISESERRSKLPELGFSQKRMEQVEFRISSVVKKRSIVQPQKARAMSLGDYIVMCLNEKLALRSWLTAMDRWPNWLPSPSGSGHMANIFCSVITDATDEMKGVKKPRKILKTYKGEYKLPKEILRLPD
jgi:hypothetical protein